jgi:sterol desaturase/sphingolipid hydroxylase (fatty acid hydroxylase superfamily)
MARARKKRGLNFLYRPGADTVMVETFFSQVVYGPLHYRFFNVILTSEFLAVVLGTLALERLVPAEPNRKLFSASTAQDFVWFFYESVFHAAIVVTYVSLLSWIYSNFVPSLASIDFNSWPIAIRFVIGTLIIDLCYYLQHRCNHRVPWLWQLHSVHHSQTQLNFFTDFRYHVLEYIVRETFLAVPFIILKISTPEIVAASMLLKWYTRFYHGNIKTHLGPLRYALVTPQSHRIHHAKQEEYRNKNFGSIFTFWDFIFRTQYANCTEYPETGIDDSNFPLESDRNVVSLLVTPLQQTWYPLRKIYGKG